MPGVSVVLGLSVSTGQLILQGPSKVGFGFTAEWSQGVDKLLTKWLASKRQTAKPPRPVTTMPEHDPASLPLGSISQSSPKASWFQGGGETRSAS